MKKVSYPFSLISKIIASTMTLYIVLPLIFLILFSFSGKIEVIPTVFTFKWYLFNPETMLSAILNTLLISVPATVLSVLVSLPLSYAVSRMKFAGRKFIDQIIVLPMIIPGTVLGLAFLQVSNSSLFKAIPGYLIIVIAHIVVTIPVITRPIIAALEQAGTLPEEAANTLGATPLRIFLTITLPIIAPSVFVGMIFGFARSITDFVMTLFIVPAGMIPMAIQIYNSTQYSIQQLTAANATVLLIFTILVVSLAELIMKKTSGVR